MKALLNRPALYLLAMVVCFAFGRYTASFKGKETEVKQQDREVEVRTVYVRVKSPDGTIREEQIKENISKDSVKTVKESLPPEKRSRINISALASVDAKGGNMIPVYGISANKEFIGPITIGAFGLTNGVVGLSIGVNF